MTLAPVITRIKNKGYVEALKKNYAAIQIATNEIIAEYGLPNNWTKGTGCSGKNACNEIIVDLYAEKFDTLYPVKFCNWCTSLAPGYKNPSGYTYLNGQPASEGLYQYGFFIFAYPFILKDGTLIGLNFKALHAGVIWGRPDIGFTIDVNGPKGPNRIGRDVFFLYMQYNGGGKVLPYTNIPFPDGGIDHRNTCEKDKSGLSCAYRILVQDNGKMNY